FAAVADSIYRKGQGCGSKYKITCVDTSEYSCISKVPVVVTVVDSCQPEGNENCPTFVLSEKVFASIADIDRGIVQVTYQL
ncbi:EXPA32, partial [Linum perenne]